jgi:hypothetical protein
VKWLIDITESEWAVYIEVHYLRGKKHHVKIRQVKITYYYNVLVISYMSGDIFYH